MDAQEKMQKYTVLVFHNLVVWDPVRGNFRCFVSLRASLAIVTVSKILNQKPDCKIRKSKMSLKSSKDSHCFLRDWVGLSRVTISDSFSSYETLKSMDLDYSGGFEAIGAIQLLSIRSEELK